MTQDSVHTRCSDAARIRAAVWGYGPRWTDLAIEVDGFAFHSGADEFQVDRTRQNDIVLRGWQVLRFTWLDLAEYPERVIAIIGSAISA